MVNWEAVGAIGELLGALAVVATLIYLSIQVRQSKAAVEENTRTARNSVLDQHTQSQSRWRSNISGDEGMAKIWVVARGGMKELDEVEAERFRQCCRDFFNVWRSSYAAAQSIDHHGQMEHIARSCSQTLLESKGVMELWNIGGRLFSELVVPEFVKDVENRINSQGST